nr:hypothetical protein CFP56_10249 [Quercus suber]
MCFGLQSRNCCDETCDYVRRQQCLVFHRPSNRLQSSDAAGSSRHCFNFSATGSSLGVQLRVPAPSSCPSWNPPVSKRSAMERNTQNRGRK